MIHSFLPSLRGRGWGWGILLLLLLASCRSSKSLQSSTGEQVRYLSSRVKLTVPSRNAVLTVSGTMKLKSGERMQMSFLMPILRSEVARLEVTPDDILLVDRMGKRYVRATREELEDLLPREADFARLEQLLFDAARPDGKRSLSGTEVGIPALEKGKIELYDFSEEPFEMTPTTLSPKYEQVSPEEILHFLMNL